MQDSFGKRLKRYRLSKLWTLDQMAVITRLSIAGLSRIERGKAVPSDLSISKIKQALPDLEVP